MKLSFLKYPRTPELSWLQPLSRYWSNIINNIRSYDIKKVYIMIDR